MSKTKTTQADRDLLAYLLGWCNASIGGVAVDRGRFEQAVAALERVLDEPESPERRMAAAEERHRNHVEITTPHPWRYAPGLSPSMCESCADCGRDPRNKIHRDPSGNPL
jgi:hypothetical protein